jgi:hypothetical protein
MLVYNLRPGHWDLFDIYCLVFEICLISIKIIIFMIQTGYLILCLDPGSENEKEQALTPQLN